MNSKKKRYNLLYLPSGRFVEILGPKKVSGQKIVHMANEWHILSKNRSDLKDILLRILQGHFPPMFYKHNEMIDYSLLKSCHFVFQRVGVNDD